MRRVRPLSLTGRLVATTVALVALVGLLVAGITTLAMRNYLNAGLDSQVRDTVARAMAAREHELPALAPRPRQPAHEHGTRGFVDGDGDGDGHEVRVPPGQRAGSLTAYFDQFGARGRVVTAGGRYVGVPSKALRVLQNVPTDGHPHVVDLPSLGVYRVLASPDGSLVAGLPTSEVNAVLSRLVGWEMLLLLLGVSLAAGLAYTLVRRQLQPLRQVATTAHDVTDLPLSSGEIALTMRVPDKLTDTRTEVGQVGAALNKLLVHVEQALGARHRSEQQVRQFVADASHELRTPLTTIHGYAQLSRRTRAPDPEQLTTAMAKVESEATRMSALVEDLLLLARLDAGRPLDRAEVDLTRLVLEAVADARVVSPDHRWKMDLPEDPIVVTGDEQRLHQVLTNLLNNARRHTPPGTSVTVGARNEDGSVVLTVHDNGPGIPGTLGDQVFERFARGDSARTRASGGAGLGLSLVQAIASAHGGSVGVRSVPGDTVFSVRLPGARSLRQSASVG